MSERRKAVAPIEAGDEELEVELEEAEAVPASGRRVSLASLTKLAPVGKFGRYHLLGRLAFGGMAEIFLAREVRHENGEHKLGRFCVVKRVLPNVASDRQFVQMFIDEARLVVQLGHPYICHVYAYGEEEGTSYIAMEWINGMPLSKTLRRSRKLGGLSLEIVLRIVAMVAEALDHAHRAVDQSTGEPLGIVHRDVSPQNVMVAYDGVVKLLDFGIAKAASHSTHTEAGFVKGKFAYMSPQQCMGEPIDARSDVFALGIVLYELISGTNPFKKQTEFDTMRALVYDDPPRLHDTYADVPEEVDEIVRRAMAKKPEDRFQSASEMQLAIEHALSRMGAVVTTAHISARMHELFAPQIEAGPRLDTRISTPSERPDGTGTSEVEARPITPRPHAAVRSERRWVVPALSGIVVVLLVLLGGTWLSLRDRPSTVPAALPPPTSAPPPRTPIVPPAEALATLYVNSTPTGATITLGDRGEIGRTPMEIALLPPGEWNVRLSLDGYDAWEEGTTLGAGQRVELAPTLVATAAPQEHDHAEHDHDHGHDRPRVRDEAPPPTTVAEEREHAAPARPSGHLAINTRPWSRVYAGSRLLGTTPIGGVELPAGEARLRFVDRDGVEHTRTVTIPEGGDAREFFDLSTDPAP
jgi:serine/threonine-protein kinase